VRREAIHDPADDGDGGLEALLPGGSRAGERQGGEIP
jgi:hypothetical protein